MQQAARRRPPRLCFVSYGALSDLARTVIQEFADRAEIEIVDATFGAAVAAARAREAAGTVDVFLSAGSNAANLREAVKLPVASPSAAPTTGPDSTDGGEPSVDPTKTLDDRAAELPTDPKDLLGAVDDATGGLLGSVGDTTGKVLPGDLGKTTDDLLP